MEAKGRGAADSEEDRDDDLLHDIEDFIDESDVDNAYNQARVDLTVLLPKRRISAGVLTFLTIRTQRAQSSLRCSHVRARVALPHSHAPDESRVRESVPAVPESYETDSYRIATQLFASHALHELHEDSSCLRRCGHWEG